MAITNNRLLLFEVFGIKNKPKTIKRILKYELFNRHTRDNPNDKKSTNFLFTCFSIITRMISMIGRKDGRL